MRSLKNILLAVSVTMTVFCSVFWLSCKKSGNSGSVASNNGPSNNGPSSTVALTPDMFIGTWNGNISCHSGGYTNLMSISKDTVADQVILHNPGFVHRDLLGTVINNTQIHMPRQSIDVDLWYEGTLTLTSDSSMTFDFSLSETTSADSCHSIYTKQ